jgi:hypothetical protein
MVAIPLLSGVAGSETGEFVQRFPLNLEPVIVDTQISKGQLRIAPGASVTGTGPGGDRGGIEWNGIAYRVMGTSLVSISASGTVTILGDVGDGDRCWFDYSFDRLAIGSGGRVYYYAPLTGLTQVIDTDLGTSIDGLWVDGYFMSTDGTYVVVTELADPTSVQPLKYGSAEEDPDAITGLLKWRDEAYILGRYTIQTFENVGGNGFPFVDRKGAGIPFGCVGPMAKCLYGDGFAFVGGARNEALNVYIGAQGQAKAIGTRALCDALAAVERPEAIEVEARTRRNERYLLVHLPDETWTFMISASGVVGSPVWFRQHTDSHGYRLRNAVQIYGGTMVADPISGEFGYLNEAEPYHFGTDPGWEFEAGMVYNEAVGAIIHSLELVGLPGRGGDGSVFLSMTRDGETYSTERAVRAGPLGARNRRIQWRPHVRIGSWLGLRFRGVGRALPGFASLEAKAVPLSS